MARFPQGSTEMFPTHCRNRQDTAKKNWRRDDRSWRRVLLLRASLGRSFLLSAISLSYPRSITHHYVQKVPQGAELRNQ